MVFFHVFANSFFFASSCAKDAVYGVYVSLLVCTFNSSLSCLFFLYVFFFLILFAIVVGWCFNFFLVRSLFAGLFSFFLCILCQRDFINAEKERESRFRMKQITEITRVRAANTSEKTPNWVNKLTNEIRAAIRLRALKRKRKKEKQQSKSCVCVCLFYEQQTKHIYAF